MPRKKATPVDEVVEEQLEQQEEVPEVEGAGAILPVNSEGTFGLQLMDRKHLVLYERTLYKEHTELKARGRGQDKTYEAGEYGPWKLSARPYPSSLSNALSIIFQWMVNDKVQEANDFSFIIECIEQAKAEILEAASKLQLK